MNEDVVINYKEILLKIEEKIRFYNRNPDDIQLIVVSKGRTWEEMAPLIPLGCRDFGESRLQEALPKIKKGIGEQIHWHFIGHLQKNKVRKVIDHFNLIHSVDSVELAEMISQASLEKGSQTAILFQVNISGEASKQGFNPENLTTAFSALLHLPGVKIEGLMTIAPFTEDEKIVRESFAGLRLLRDRLQDKSGHPLPHLSMGMSHDYPLAIAEGSTLLRIGSAIFHFPLTRWVSIMG